MLNPLSSLAVRKKNVTLWKTLGLLSFGYTNAQLEATLLQSARCGATDIWKSAFISLGSRTSPEVWRDSLANAALSGNVALYQIIEEDMLTHSHCREEYLSLDRILAGAVESGSMQMLDYISQRHPKAIARAMWRGLMHSAIRSESSDMMTHIRRLTPPEELAKMEWYSLLYTALRANSLVAVDWICNELEFSNAIDWNMIAGHYMGGDMKIQERLNNASDRMHYRLKLYGPLTPAEQPLQIEYLKAA
ncbi:MAG: hypothetical protein DI585_06935 [Pseudomonas fluorescens]|nr:MAG: hypothetical protein DI585_06935 [Pseudomonas fluorescens]